MTLIESPQIKLKDVRWYVLAVIIQHPETNDRRRHTPSKLPLLPTTNVTLTPLLQLTTHYDHKQSPPPLVL